MPNKFQFVLLSQAKSSNAVSNRYPNCIFVTQTKGKLVEQGTNAKQTANQITLPKAHFSLYRAMESAINDWIKVIDWLNGLTDARSLVIADFDHPLRELLLLADARNSFIFGLYFPHEFTQAFTPDYALLSCSKIMLFDDTEIELDFRNKYVGPFLAAHSQDDLITGYNQIFSRNACSNNTYRPKQITQQHSLEGTPKTRILIVSYFSGPCRTVGVQRVNYWVEQLAPLAKGQIETHLVTATNWSSKDLTVHYVSDRHIASLLSKDSTFSAWTLEFAKTEQQHAKSFNTLSYYWRYALERYFDGLEEHFDVVLISGNPFAVFDFTAYAKRRWSSRVILDYRDPFANNPRIKYLPTARDNARYVEKGYNLQADLALVVNRHCQKMLAAPEDIPSTIIPNGFDERILNDLSCTAPNGKIIKFVHAGQFYAYGSPEKLLQVLTAGNHEFHHIGRGIECAQTEKTNTLVTHGNKPYNETLQIIGNCDCGIIYLSEESFETTTKVFDYMAMGIDILVCTEGETREGVLADMLNNREGVYWCRNTKLELSEFVSEYKPTREPNRVKAYSAKYTRKHSAELLLHQIETIISQATFT